MANNNIKSVLEKEGVEKGRFMSKAPYNKHFVRKVYNQKKAPSLSAKEKIVEIINDLTSKKYTLVDIFPEAAPNISLNGKLRKAGKSVRKRDVNTHYSETEGATVTTPDSTPSAKEKNSGGGGIDKADSGGGIDKADTDGGGIDRKDTIDIENDEDKD